MVGKYVIVALALLAGCMAVPTPEQSDDLSFFFSGVDSSSRIVGGSTAPAGSHPHMVALTSGLLLRSFFCGGSVITQRSILTAAHCVNSVYSWGSLSSSIRATVGTVRWNSGGQTYSFSRNITHPNYLQATIKNDLSILVTSSNIVFNNLVAPIALTYDQIGAGVQARVAGWGRTRNNIVALIAVCPTTKVTTNFIKIGQVVGPLEREEANGALSATLLEIVLPTIDGASCVSAVAQAAIDFNTRAPPVEPHIELCTYHLPNFGTCQGDSGSALARESDGRQIGIVSWGFPCARGAPDVFVRVSGYSDWLSQNIVN